MTGSWASGRTIAGAASMAIERINSDPTLLGGGRRRKPVVAELKWLDSGCSAGKGLESMMELLADTKVAAVIGPGAPSLASGGNRLPFHFNEVYKNVQDATMHAKRRCSSHTHSLDPSLNCLVPFASPLGAPLSAGSPCHYASAVSGICHFRAQCAAHLICLRLFIAVGCTEVPNGI